MRYFGLLIAFLFYTSSFATTYYVSTAGNDNNNGSSTSPYRTIAKAASLVNAGDEVLISGGIYSEKEIKPKSSGTEGKYIVFKPNPGSGAVIVKHPATSVADKSPIFQLSSRSYIWIEGLQFKDFKYGLACIYISSGTGNVVTNNRFENLGNSEVAAWNGNQMVAVFNGLRNVVFNNYFSNIIGDGINVNSQNSAHNLVCYNTFLGFKGKLRSWGGSYLYSRAVDVQDMANGNNVVAFNYAKEVVHHVWLDRDGSNNVVLRNYGHTGSGNVFNESRCADNVIQENISVKMNVGYMSAYYETTGWTYDPRWINNVAYNNATGFNIHKSERDEFRNNICYNNTSNNINFTAEAKSNGPHIFKNNLWFTNGKTNSTKYLGNATSVADFQAGVGETNGLSVNPLFKNTASGSEDFTLQASSPAKGAGDNGLDLGAFAYYPSSQFGWNPSLNTADVVVYFDQVISEVERGNEVQFTVRLNKAATQQVSVDITPVAGDAVYDEDIQLASTNVTFQVGETSKTVTLVTGNSADHDELVAFRLTNASNAVAGARNLRVLRVKAGAAPTLKPETNPNETAEPVMHFYICFGQSNMSGQGEVTPEYETVSDRFKVLRAGNHSGQTVGEIYPGLSPLAHSGSKMSPADFFGRKMVELTPDNVTIVVTSIAIGSQPIDAFHPDFAQAHYENAVNNGEWYRNTMGQFGGNLYNRIIEMGQIAKQKGVIKGILFHQGENDAHKSHWPQRVRETYYSILEDLELEEDDVPFLMGELGHSDNGGTLGSRNSIIASTAASMSNAHVIPSSGCPLLVEESYTLHFTREGYKILGERYAEKAFELCKEDLPTGALSVTFSGNSTSLQVNESTNIQATTISAISSIAFYANGDIIGTDNSAPYSMEWTPTAPGNYVITAKATDNEGKVTTSTPVNVTVTVPQSPFNGTPHLIPGLIELEEYDLGGEGLGFHEGNAKGNEGGASFRDDEVDIEVCLDTDGGYNIGYALKDEWLAYTVDVTSSGSYTLDLRVAADGDNKTIHIEIDEEDVTGPIAIPNTGGWQNWETITVNDVALTAGLHTMKVVFDVNYINLNYVVFKSLITGGNTFSERDFRVYPNPTNGVVYFSSSADWKLMNAKGIELDKGTNGTQIDLSDYSAGFYFMLLDNKSYKIIKQ